MSTLTKTQQKLIHQMRNSSINCVTIISGYRTSRKNGRYGERSYQAAKSLIAAGIARKVDFVSQVDCRNKFTDHWSELTIELIREV